MNAGIRLLGLITLAALLGLGPGGFANAWLPTVRSAPVGGAWGSSGAIASAWAPDGSLVVARATGDAWSLTALSPSATDAAGPGAPQVGDCDETRPQQRANLSPNPMWPVTVNNDADGTCALYAAPIMDTHGLGLDFVELRVTGDVGGEVVIQGPALAVLDLRCSAPAGLVALPDPSRLGAPTAPGWLPLSTGLSSCSLMGSPPSAFPTWFGTVSNDNHFGSVYAAAG